LSDVRWESIAQGRDPNCRTNEASLRQMESEAVLSHVWAKQFPEALMSVIHNGNLVEYLRDNIAEFRKPCTPSVELCLQLKDDMNISDPCWTQLVKTFKLHGTYQSCQFTKLMFR
jgi:hypothetical protein